METKVLDPRINAYRADIADVRLDGKVQSRRFVEGDECQVQVETLAIMPEPNFEKPLLSECLAGELVRVFEVRDGWAWGQLLSDHYVGFMPLQGLTPQITNVDYQVTALRTFLYEHPDIKSPPVSMLSLNALLSTDGLTDTDSKFLKLQSGQYIYKDHCAGIGSQSGDFVAIAQRFLGTPYLWGGRTSVGLDCSALVQMALLAVGRKAPRDSDMQEQGLGQKVEIDQSLDGLKRGDLIFWKGHVGIMQNSHDLLHANAHFMEVTSELLRDAVGRIKQVDGNTITSVKRL